MNKVLYINLFKEIDISDLISQIEENTNNYYLDFQGKNKESEDISNINPEEFDNYSNIYNNAVKEYTTVVAELSTVNLGNKNIRSFTFNQLPIYWLTNVSEKHYFHWLMKFFLLKELLTEKIDFFHQYNQIIIVLPNKYEAVNHLIQKEFDSLKIKTSVIRVVKNRVRHPYFRLLKNNLKLVYLFLKMEKPQLTNEKKKNIFILTGSPTAYTSDFFKNIINISNNNFSEASLIPLNYWSNSNNPLNLNIPRLYWKSRLTVFDLMYNSVKQIKLFYKLNKTTTEFIGINNIHFPSSILVDEMKDVLLNQTNMLSTYCWLKKYAKRLNYSPSFFYEDEVYPHGRAISLALQNKKTYGVQHSMIPKNHSVYHISDKEINNITKNDGLPLPSNFLVWGNYFKTQFLSHNSITSNFIVVTGNPTYIKRNNNSPPSQKNKNAINLLYGLTTLSFFEKEKYIIKKTLSHYKKIDITIRFHPLHIFDEKIIINFFSPTKVNFSNTPNIFEEINQNDILMVSAHSGAWLDAIVAKKPVIRLTTAFTDDINNNGLMFNVKDNKEFEAILENITTKKDFTLDNELLYLQANKWIELINS